MSICCPNGHPVDLPGEGVALPAHYSVCGAPVAWEQAPATSKDRTTDDAGPSPTADGELLPELPGYEVLEPLGEGGFGRVYRARETSLGREVAIKVLTGGAWASPQDRARFRREAEAMAALKHAHLLPVYAVNEAGGVPYLVMELAEGGCLADQLDGRPRFDHPATAALLEQLARAIHHVHRRGVLHRDLKPANVLLAADGTPKVTDFGLARRLDGTDRSASGGHPVGTAPYMAPEQATGAVKKLTAAVDVYGLGAILYELLTGRPPFRERTVGETLHLVLTAEPVPVRRLQRGVPRDLETICLKCLHKEPRKRYATAEALADDLRRFGEGRPVLARPVGRAERAWRWCRRRPAVAGLLAGLVAALIGGVSGIVWQWREAVASRRQAESNFQVALTNNIAVKDLAEELKPLAGTQAETVRRILQAALDSQERLQREAGETPPVVAQRAQMLNSFSELYIDLGDTTRALNSAEEARRLFDRLLSEESENTNWQSGLATSWERIGVARMLRESLPKAMEAHREALAIRQRLIALAPEQEQFQNDLASSHSKIANIHFWQGDYPAARETYQKAFELRQRLAQQAPSNRLYQADLGVIQEKLGDVFPQQEDLAGILVEYEKAYRIHEVLVKEDVRDSRWHQNLVRTRVNMGQQQKALMQVENARESFQAALRIAEDFSRRDPAHAEWQRLVLLCRFNLAELRQKDDRREALKDGVASMRDLVTLNQARVKQDPSNVAWQSGLTGQQWVLGFYLLALANLNVDRQANLNAAESVLKDALDLRKQLVEQDPTNYHSALNLGNIHSTRARLLHAQGKTTEGHAVAIEGHRSFVSFFERQFTQDPANVTWRIGLVRKLNELGNELAGQNNQAALAEYQRVGDLCNEQLRQQPSNIALKGELARSHLDAAGVWGRQVQLLMEIAKLQTALPLYAAYDWGWQVHLLMEIAKLRTALPLYDELLKGQPDNLAWRKVAASGYQQICKSFRMLNDDKGALEALRKYLDHLDWLLTNAPPEAEKLIQAAASRSASVLAEGSRVSFVDNQLALARKRFHLGELVLLRLPQTADRVSDHAVGCLSLALVLRATQGEAWVSEARRVLQRGLSLLRKLQEEKQSHPVYEKLIRLFEAKLQELPGADDLKP